MGLVIFILVAAIIVLVFLHNRKHGNGPLSRDGTAPKDPKDFTLDENSTPWISYRHCTKCKQPIGHEEYCSQICNKCGEDPFILASNATRRKIWTGSRWIFQYKFPSGTKFNETFPPTQWLDYNYDLIGREILK